MDLLIIALILSITKFCLICKFIGLRKALYFDKYIDLFFTLVLPLAFFGTFSGMVVAVLSGLSLSMMLLIAKIFFKPERPAFLNRWSRNKR